MKKWLQRILKALLIGVVGLIVIFALGIYLLGKGMCDTFDIAEYKSPSGKKTLVRSTFGCGATTQDTTSIVLKGLRDQTVISVNGAVSDDLDAKWIDENTVVINFSGNGESINENSTKLSGITFYYKNGFNDLNISCYSAECEKISRVKELAARKEWCNYSTTNRAYCDSPEHKGYETCEDGSWCHYFDNGCDSSPEAKKRCDDGWAEANRPLVTLEQQVEFMKEKTAEILTYRDDILQLTFTIEAQKYLDDPNSYYAFKSAAFLNELEKRKAISKDVEDMRLKLLDKYGPCWGVPVGRCIE